jgi:hypothetical protein
MTPPDDLYAEAQRSRLTRRWRVAFVILAVVLVASGTAFALTGPLSTDDGSDLSTNASHRIPSDIPTIPGPPTGASEEAGCRPALDPDDPLRLWVGGDSLAGSLGPSLGELTGRTGVVQPTFHSRVSSGLRSPDFFDWPARAPQDLLTYDPEVAVFIIGTNDAKGLALTGTDDDEWRSEYSELVEEMLTLLIGEGRRVYWVGAPIMKERTFSQRVEEVNAVFREVISRHPEARYVDAFTLFSDASGEYSTTLPTEDDDSVAMRAGDGVHLTTEGGLRLAQVVFADLDTACRITDQAVPDEAKKTVEVRSGAQSGSGRRTGTPTQTIPPTTVPATVPETTAVAPTTTVPPVSLPQVSVPVPPSAPCIPPACRPQQSQPPQQGNDEPSQ